MKVTLHKAFGYIVVKNVFETENEELQNHQWANGPVSSFDVDAIWITAEGLSRFTEVNTGVIEEYGPGDFTPDVPTPGLWQFKACEYPTTIFCLEAGNLNEGIDLHMIEKFTLKSGETVTLQQGTKLFLAHGTLTVDGSSHSGTKQLKLSTGEKTLTATTDCYGFIFP